MPAPPQPTAAGLPAVSDEECIAKGVSFGGDEEALLAVLNSSKSGTYLYVYARVGGAPVGMQGRAALLFLLGVAAGQTTASQPHADMTNLG